MSGIAHGHGELASRVPGTLAEGPDASVPWAIVTDPGPTRRHNEDRWSVDAAHGVFALADGMGGYNAGEVAAEIAVRTASQLAGALHDAGLAAPDVLLRAVSAAHAGIVDYAHSRPECLGMATTLLVASIRGGRLTIAHVGDSRAYLLRAGTLRRLTVDHSIGQRMLDEGRLSEAQVRRLPSRGILTRALGIETEPPKADLLAFDWLEGDLLLLASDGLTDSLDDAALAAMLATPAESLAAQARALVAEALARGCTDDATVLLAGGGGFAPLAH
ncbi:MAG: serine/threonine-protein phosphatase [Burkholderiales bacterium]|nr:MAG: serine/threonine-protein phosphatase [Burkholderiales bacterium]